MRKWQDVKSKAEKKINNIFFKKTLAGTICLQFSSGLYISYRVWHKSRRMWVTRGTSVLSPKIPTWSTIETPSYLHRQYLYTPNPPSSTQSTVKTNHQMSENKLRKFINKQTPPLTGKKRLQPIVLSDSKGRYIDKLYRDTTEKQLIIICQSGLKSEENKQWL